MISDKQSIAELFSNHFVRIAEGVRQLDTEDYCEDFRDQPSVYAMKIVRARFLKFRLPVLYKLKI